jgi:heme/copper-type cytochrome/quinol oxidase subunit 2
MHLNSNFISASNSASPAPTSSATVILEKELGEKLLNYGTQSNLIDATNSTIEFFWNIAIVVVIVFIVVSGLKFITSIGDKAKVQEAKDSLKYSIIALLILATLNFVVFTFFKDFFGGGKNAIGEKPVLRETTP